MHKASSPKELGKLLLPLAKEAKGSFLIGFDGFTDDIIDVVQTRSSIKDYTAFPTIEAFGQRVLECKAKSANIELVPKQRKLGGNAPILCNALLNQGFKGSFIGPIGEKEQIEPLFSKMAEQCETVVSFGPSAHTDALEFADGKLMLGKHQAIRNIDFANLLRVSSKEELIRLFDQASLFGNTTWTLLLGMNDLWEGLLREILPSVPKKDPLNNKRQMFVDLCDPTKREKSELIKALEILKEFLPWYDITLGLNIVEIVKVAECFDYQGSPQTEEEFADLASFLQEKSKLTSILLHTKTFSLLRNSQGLFHTKVPFCESPKISTGAGDNFNAGYCSALLLGLPPLEALWMGVATSGFYVREAHSPSLQELSSFLEKQDFS